MATEGESVSIRATKATKVAIQKASVLEVASEREAIIRPIIELYVGLLQEEVVARSNSIKKTAVAQTLQKIELVKTQITCEVYAETTSFQPRVSQELLEPLRLFQIAKKLLELLDELILDAKQNLAQEESRVTQVSIDAVVDTSVAVVVAAAAPPTSIAVAVAAKIAVSVVKAIATTVATPSTVAREILRVLEEVAVDVKEDMILESRKINRQARQDVVQESLKVYQQEN